MSISSVTSSSVASVAQQRPQGPGKEIREGVGQLKKAIASGDLDSVQKAYDSLSKLQSDRQSSSVTGSGTGSASGASNSNDPLSKMLTAVGDALKTGDISQVQQAFEANGPKGAGGGRGPGGPGGGRPMGPPPDGGQGGPSSEVKSAMGSLAQSLQSGDLSGAQDAFSSLAKLLGSSTDSDSSGSSSSGSSTSGSSTSSSSAASATSSASSAEDLFKTMLNNLGTALQSGDLSGAQKAFSSMAPRGSQGVNVLA